MMKTTFALAFLGLAAATRPDPNCGKLLKCTLINLEENTERKVFDFTGTTIVPDGPTIVFDSAKSSRGWSINCETSGNVDYVKYEFEDGSIQKHYSMPWYINGDGGGTWINQMDSLKCGAQNIKVSVHTWTGDDKYPCDSKSLKLSAPVQPPVFNSCHYCRRCGSFRFHTSEVIDPRLIPDSVGEIKFVKRGGVVSLQTPSSIYGRDYFNYYRGRKFSELIWRKRDQFVEELKDAAVYIRVKNGCGMNEWKRCSIGSPVALDLDGSGDVEHIDGKFDFDLNGNGVPEELVEWFAPSEGILVDSTYPGFDSGTLSGWHLYGDLGGLHEDGYEKLALHDFNGDGKVSGDELEGIAVWVDANSNAKVDEGEVSTLASHDVVSLDLSHDKDYISSAKLEDGRDMVTRDLWFAR